MSDQVIVNEIKIYSFGDILAGLDKEEFTETEEILEVRRSISKLAEMLKNDYNESKSPVKSLLFDQAIGQLTAAQLIVEKLLNMK